MLFLSEEMRSKLIFGGLMKFVGIENGICLVSVSTWVKSPLVMEREDSSPSPQPVLSKVAAEWLTLLLRLWEVPG